MSFDSVAHKIAQQPKKSGKGKLGIEAGKKIAAAAARNASRGAVKNNPSLLKVPR